MLIPELKELLTRDKGSEGDYRGSLKLKSRKEFTYIYFYQDFSSPIRDWPNDERHIEAMKYAMLEPKGIDDKVLAASERYRLLIIGAARSLRTYRALLKTMDSMDKYMEELDFTKLTKTGELLHSPDKVANTVTKMDGMFTAIKNFEKKVDEELRQNATGIRGANSLGDQEENKRTGVRNWSESDIAENSSAAALGTSGTGTFASLAKEIRVSEKASKDALDIQAQVEEEERRPDSVIEL